MLMVAENINIYVKYYTGKKRKKKEDTDTLGTLIWFW